MHDLLLVELFDVQYYCDLKCGLEVTQVIESGTI